MAGTSTSNWSELVMPTRSATTWAAVMPVLISTLSIKPRCVASVSGDMAACRGRGISGGKSRWGMQFHTCTQLLQDRVDLEGRSLSNLVSYLLEAASMV